MSTITTTLPTMPAAPPPSSVHRITVDEYERIIVSGALNDPDRVELIDGVMVDKMGKSAEHGFTTKEIYTRIASLLPPGWTFRTEQPIRIPDYDEPEPDVSVVRGSNSDYRHRIPTASDASLVVEVSLSSLADDRGKKLAAYAGSGIPTYWIANLADGQVEVYTGPQPTDYQSRTDYKPGQFVPVVIDGVEVGRIAVDDILP